MPWYAIVAIVAIVIFGAITILSMVTGKPLPWSQGGDPGELETLRRRLDALERGTARPELEQRIERLEARQDRREARDLEQDRWTRRARELGLDGDGEPTRG
ncbi:MAG: hypothetical protein QJR09_04300 [Micrococcus sp.]|nr:hypothetical protein [Micrococcus sp.]